MKLRFSDSESSYYEFLIMKPCCLLGGYQLLGGTYWFHVQGRI